MTYSKLAYLLLTPLIFTGCLGSTPESTPIANTPTSPSGTPVHVIPSTTPPVAAPTPDQPTVSRDETLVVTGRYADADVVEIKPGLWRLYYGVEPDAPGHRFEIYTATSADSVAWEQQSSPVLEFATFPDAVVLPDGRVRLYFQDGATRSIASAISNDQGATFAKETGTRIALQDTSAGAGVAAPTILQLQDDSWLMVYRQETSGPYSNTSINQTITSFYSARSTDGLTFNDNTLIVDGRSDTFDGYIDGPELFSHAGTTYLRFWTSAGRTNGQDAGQYEMTSTDGGATWSTPQLIYSTDTTGLLGGDPTYGFIQGTWQMFYTKRGEGIFKQTAPSIQ